LYRCTGHFVFGAGMYICIVNDEAPSAINLVHL